MNETELHETLDERGLLEAAQTNEGAYALELEPPADSVSAIKDEWLAVEGNRISPPRATLAPMAHKPRLVYVGAAYNRIYDRLAQHANGHKSATVMEVYPAQDVFGIYPDEREFNVGRRLSTHQTTIWVDGNTL